MFKLLSAVAHLNNFKRDSRMTEIDDSLTAMDWLVNPAIDIFSGLKINSFLFDQVSPPEARDYLNGSIKSEPTHPDKPPYSYAELIKKAIESSPQRKMTLNEIYEWICKNFPYYREGQNGWKVNVCFKYYPCLELYSAQSFT